MTTPIMEPKSAKIIIYDDVLDAEEIPSHVLANIQENRKFIWWALLFLNGSCLWAYYSCLSAQTYYAARFANTTLQFGYLTTPVITWPMFIGHLVQVLFGLDKQLGLLHRVRLGYSLFILCAIAIVLQDVLDIAPSTGGVIVLVAFGTVGFTNSLTEAAFYALSALFPEAAFTNAIQLGNGTSGVINITLNTLIQLMVGGSVPAPDTTATIQRVSFYIFFSVFIAVCFMAVVVYHKLLRIPAVHYLMQRNDLETAKRHANRESLVEIWMRLGRITRVIWLPLVSQIFIFTCSLVAFPGIGIASGYQLAGDASWGNWYVNGVLLSYNYGDFVGRVLSPKLYPFFSLESCFTWTILRWGLFVCLLLGLPGDGRNPLFIMAGAHGFNIFWQLFVNFVLGLSTGVLSTITFGLGPRLVHQEDRESAGAIMCLGLFLGICIGATFGLQFGEHHWLGA
ncbi:Equilibrative Nucleoside Transporter (ENT) Family [Achlya hypogyna]|uniref:Equilibrative Nucleoside Transporter (ENT) Family n=1 Tax=Achlya hypogyna TaxID=1202772 RepID=A0A1V9Z2I6_ACHHY|nr:Equilibrative Nucleoside Transporter (ENT) Family [Achlya hypogyna]